MCCFFPCSSLVQHHTSFSGREGWPFIDALPDNEEVCQPDSTRVLPIGLHYCKRYSLEKNFFSKYRIKKNM
jgi:hypothetical protein